ncbi:FAD-binding oxidoreductase [Naasia sp. SYSU D00057]|uniref:FAD-binding oxidoreductase n=1 Tax=Naasia sp. SYSU D00057 TaxID=2817380 RepID=UPI001B31123C|nr:FAD-linked oxidase C-terminal domain-containing protein [Naasia sp. SYSU D00057]
MTSPLIDRLRSLLPPDAVVTEPDALAPGGQDMSRSAPSGVAAVLVRPRTTEQVAEVLRTADELQVPVVPQGARSGLVGAAAAMEGAVLLDLSRMDRILRIDAVDGVAVVQPGVVIADLQRAAAAQGLFYAPDPASADRATVGGTIATNAGGMRCVKYGVTRDAVRSLEVVLADGTVVRTRPATAKGVAGLDLTSLIVGSEGVLAVVTEATLALLPAPGPSRAVAGTFRTVADAIAAAGTIAAGPRLPSTLEFLDGVALRGVRIVLPEIPLPADATAWLIAVTDVREGAEEDLESFAAAFRDHGAITVARAEDPHAVEDLFAARRALNPALTAVRGGATHGDLAVPRSQLPALVEGAAEIQSRLGVEISLAGHVGDGNLHPTIVFDPSDAAEAAAARQAEGELLALAQTLGGTVAGEHGIGTLKLDAIAGELAPRILELQHGVKAVFDPKGILNPGRKLGGI